MEVIVLDGNQRSALAVVRSLGRKGIVVRVGAESLPSLASTSKYCSGSFIYPSPYRDAPAFLQTIYDVNRRVGRVMLLPMTDVTVGEILANRSAFCRDTVIPSVDYQHYLAASAKDELFRLAGRLEVPIPATRFSIDYVDDQALVNEAAKLGFPIVVKPARSRFKVNHGWIESSVRYARSKKDLHEIIRSEPFNRFPFIMQERIQGPGVGIFFLIRQGEVLACFAHRRIREKPPSGGVSVLCESIAIPPAAYRSAVQLLRELNWYGVAMVEFKRDQRDGVCRLMEINARFWGSLQLSVSAGVNFPYLLYCLAKGQAADTCDRYRIGLRSRWELGDLDHLYLRLFKRSRDLALPNDAPGRAETLMSFIGDFASTKVRAEVMRPADPLPFLFEIKQYIKNLL